MPLSVDQIAAIAHESNRQLCCVLGETDQPAWEDAPDWQKASVRAGVRALREGGSTDPEENHQRWRAHKEAQGWRYGPTKDPRRKTHPCMVPYADLPEGQRRKDALFVAVVTALTRDET